MNQVPESCEKISSKYLLDGVKLDCWNILSIHFESKRALAKIEMLSYYNQFDDKSDFHLSIISAMEMASQLSIITMLHYLGYTEKTVEIFLANCQVKCKRSIKDPKNISAESSYLGSRKVGDRIFSQVDTVLSDYLGGCISISMSGLC